MPVFQCTRDASLGRFLRGRLTSIQGDTFYFQRWRILELLRSHPGSIVVRHGGTSRPAGSERDRVQGGDHVLVNLQPLRRNLPVERYHDYGCVPRTPLERDGGTDDYAIKARNFLTTRPRSRRLASDNLEEFVSDILSSDEIDQPVRNLVMVSHSNAYGDLGLPVRAASSDPWTSYDDLQQLVDAQAASETLRNALHIRQAILEPQPGSTKFHIRGCNVGKEEFRPVLQKLKQALGNTVNITAPKFFHYMSHLPPPNAGYFEWLAYGFRLLRRSAFNGDSTQARRVQLITAFLQEARREGSHIKYYDDSSIDSVVLGQWLPVNLDPNNPGPPVGATKERTWNVSVQTPVRPFNVTARFWYRRWDGNIAFTWRMEFPEDPHGDRDILMSALRQSLRDPERTPLFQERHEFPAFRRYGYNTFEEFIDGWDWQFSPRADSVITATGTRHEYKLIYPITNRNSAQLLLNYYPSTPDQHPILHLPNTDPFFTEV